MGYSMTTLGKARLLAAVVVLAVAGAGCAAHWAHRQGQEATDKGDWDLAVARYTRALDKDPKNIRYKIALENARVQASRFHYDEAKKHLAANDLEKAAEELQIASNYDPANRSADWTPVYSEPEPDRPGESPGVYDVKSASELVSLAGTPYNEW